MKLNNLFAPKLLVSFFLALVLTAGAVALFDRDIRKNAIPHPKPKIPAIDAHIQAAPAELPKLRFLSRVNNIRLHLLTGAGDGLLKGKGGLKNIKNNNLELDKLVKSQPLNVEFLPAIEAEDPQAPELAQKYIREGAMGIKLYDGAERYYRKPLDSAAKRKLYKVCEEKGIPIIYYVNLDKYRREFENILLYHPRLIVVVPYLGFLHKKLEVLGELLDRYPNLYIDFGFGSDRRTFVGFRRVTREFERNKNFFEKYHKRILFSTGLVFKEGDKRNRQWHSARQFCAREMLEKDKFQCPVVSYIIEEMNRRDERRKKGFKPRETNPTYRGLKLEEATLRDILYKNAIRVFPKLARNFTPDELGQDFVVELRAITENRAKKPEPTIPPPGSPQRVMRILSPEEAKAAQEAPKPPPAQREKGEMRGVRPIIPDELLKRYGKQKTAE